MWEKLMKEVKNKRTAGPFPEINFKNFIQSPIGLVPKSGNKTRLIFHLSYKFSDEFDSVNHYIPPEMCTVKYNDLDYAVTSSLKLLDKLCLDQTNTFSFEGLYYAKSDLVSAFRILRSFPNRLAG